MESEHDALLRQKFVDRLSNDILDNITDIIHKQVLEAQTLNQPMNEFLDVMKKEFGLVVHDVEEKLADNDGYKVLADTLGKSIKDQLAAKLAAVDSEQLYKVFRDVYLYHIDTLWIKHLDEMEELRDKVGLVGYAQLDPLVIYKSEAFTKFQNLLYRLKYDVTAYIASLDFAAVQQQAQAPQVSL
jgi:preprotein translocase subunit SecA